MPAIAAAGAALIAAAVVWTGFRASAERELAEWWLLHTKDVQLTAERLLSDLRDAETSQRGYLLIHDAASASAYASAASRVRVDLNRLRAFTADNGAQQGRMRLLRELIAAKLSVLSEGLDEERGGRHDEAVSLVASGRGALVMDRTRAVIQAIDADETRLLVLRRADLEAAAFHDRAFAAAMAVFGFLMLFAAGNAAVLVVRARDRERASAALAASENRLRHFVERAPAAIAMFDDQMRYLAASQRYLADYGLDRHYSVDTVVGRHHHELVSWTSDRWRDRHLRVMAGESQAEDEDSFARPDGGVEWVRWEMVPWFSDVERVGGALLFAERLTPRKEAERRRTLLLAVSDLLRDDPRDALPRISTLVGEHLGVNRCGFGEADETGVSITIAHEHVAAGSLSQAGVYRLHDFGADLAGALLKGSTVVVSDVRSDPRTRAAADVHQASGNGALMTIPLLRDGRVRAVFYVNHPLARPWSPKEVALVEEVASRTWSRVEQSRAEAALKQREEQLRLAEAVSGMGSFEWDAATNRAVYSQQYIALHGLPAEVTSEGFEDWLARVHPADRESAAAAALAVFQPEPVLDAEYRIVRPSDGAVRWISERRRAFFDESGVLVRAVGSHRDITEQREAELALRESDLRFRALVEAMPTVAFAARPDGRNDFLSRRWIEYTGQDPEAALGEGWARALHPDDREPTFAAWSASLASGEIFELEHRIRGADGTYRWFLTRSMPLRDAGGVIVRWFGASTDIQDIVAAREVLSRSQSELERLVDERTRDLRETQAHLAHVRRVEALGQLAGGIAHDFNNVLQSVQGAAALIERRPEDPQSVRRMARMALEAVQRGAGITQRLLTFSRRGDLKPQAVDAPTLLADLREILSHTLGAGVRVVVEASDGLPPLLADKGQLETVFINLATNARDAMSGAGTLTLGAAAVTLADDRRADDSVDGGAPPPPGLRAADYLRLTVRDTGVGMTAEVLARVTEPFFTTKPPGAGTGLGLAMARGFAEQSGGGLQVDSALGVGTTVSLWLPAAAIDATEEPAGSNTRHSSPRHVPSAASLLVVDDEPLVRETVGRQLEAAGYRVVAAAGGPEALALVDAGAAFDLVISDLSMPGMDGISLVREMQRQRPTLPAILLTGFASAAAETAIGGSMSGAVALLRKPVTGEQLRERVALMLEAAPVADMGGSG